MPIIIQYSITNRKDITPVLPQKTDIVSITENKNSEWRCAYQWIEYLGIVYHTFSCEICLFDMLLPDDKHKLLNMASAATCVISSCTEHVIMHRLPILS